MTNWIQVKGLENKLRPEILRKNKFFFGWLELSFTEKQKYRESMEEDLRRLIDNSKLIDYRNHESLLGTYERNRRFLNRLYQLKMSELSNSEFEFFDTYNMFRCFSAKILPSPGVIEHMTCLLSESELKDRSREMAYNQFLEQVSLTKQRPVNKRQLTSFEIWKSDIDELGVDFEDIKRSVTSVVPDCEIIKKRDYFLIRFFGSQRTLGILKILKIQCRTSARFNTVFNCGKYL